MPPKSSNKKNTAAASWYFCEICKVYITVKDRETHEQFCPISTAERPHVALDYIRGDELFTTTVEQRTFGAEELKQIPERLLQLMIFISDGAMSLAKFHIGQELVISAPAQPDLVPLVRQAWPVPDKFLTTIFANAQDFNDYWWPFRTQTIKVTALPKGCAASAQLLRLHLLEVEGQTPDLVETQLRELERFLALELKHCIYTLGSSIRTLFFNKVYKLKVDNWLSFKDSYALESAFQNLSLEKNEFFKVTCGTRIEIFYDNQEANADEQNAANLITKQHIGGLAEEVAVVEESLEIALGLRPIPKGIKISRGMLLHGPAGCGKTLICEAMCSMLKQQQHKVKVAIIRINTGELFSKFLGETEKNLAAYFEKAYAHFPQPSLIIIEDIHNLCAKHETTEVAKRVCVAFVGMLHELQSRREAQRTFVLATTSQIEDLHASVRRCGCLDSEVEIGAPTPKGREQILRCLLSGMDHQLSDDDVAQMAQLTHGFVGADLAHLLNNASLRTLEGTTEMRSLSGADLQAALTQVKPSAMREVLIENPNVHWSDIGGQAELKLKLQQAIEWPLQHPEKFQRLGIKPPRGVLMFGPPGCSKTMVAKALATESNLNFLSIKGPELFSMWVGESERAVREIFRKARQVSPSIVFFDEIDAISSERSEEGSGSSVKERVLTQLLTELDGVEALENVTIVAATNRPDMIDKALLRPGRIDRIIYVGLPNDEARAEIFRIKLARMPVAKDVCLEELVKRSVGYSGAEIQAVCQEAALKTLEESLDAKHVTWQQFEYALSVVKPRTSPDLLRLYEDYMRRH